MSGNKKAFQKHTGDGLLVRFHIERPLLTLLMNRGLEAGNVLLLFPDMPCMKRVYKDKWASAHWSAARNEERL